MALKMLFETPQGVTLPEAYLKVTAAVYSARGGRCTANVTTYASEAARKADKPAVEAFSVAFTYDLDSADNLIKQAYAAVKLRPEFAGAVDC